MVIAIDCGNRLLLLIEVFLVDNLKIIDFTNAISTATTIFTRPFKLVIDQ